MSISRKSTKATGLQHSQGTPTSASHQHHKNLRRHLDMGPPSYGGIGSGYGGAGTNGDSGSNSSVQTTNLFEIKKRSIDFFQKEGQRQTSSGMMTNPQQTNSTVGDGDTANTIRRASPASNVASQFYNSSKRGSTGNTQQTSLASPYHASGVSDSIINFNSSAKNGSMGAQQLFFKNHEQSNQQPLSTTAKAGGFFRRNASNSGNKQKNEPVPQQQQQIMMGQSPQMSPRNIKDLLQIRHAVESIRNRKSTTNQVPQPEFIKSINKAPTTLINSNYQPQTAQNNNRQNIKRTSSNDSSLQEQSKIQSSNSKTQKQNFFSRPMSGHSNSGSSSSTKHKQSTSSKASSSKMSSQAQYSQQNVGPQLSQDQLIEYIQKLIKNNKKHFDKDPTNEELISNLKQILQQQYDDKSGTLQSHQNDPNSFNQLINDLIRMNYHQQSNSKTKNGKTTGPQLTANKKERASSEKTAQQSTQNKFNQSSNSNNPQQNSQFRPTVNFIYNPSLQIKTGTVVQSVHSINVQNVMITPMAYNSASINAPSTISQNTQISPHIPNHQITATSSAQQQTIQSRGSKKRNASEDNVNIQQQQQRMVMAAQQQQQQLQQQLQGGHRKALPSLDTERQGKSRSKNRVPSSDPVPMAIKIESNIQASYQPPSRENSQSSYKPGKPSAASSGSSAINTSGNNVNISNENISYFNASNSKDTTVGASSAGPGETKVDETIIQERDRLIKFIKSYIKKHNELPPTTLEYYKFVKLIGKGAFGKVTLGVHKLTGKYVAIKTIEKSYMKDDFSKRKVFQEVYLLKKIKHSNVIRLLEVFESSKHLLMVMEYAGGGDLLRLIKRKGKLQESDAKFIFKQISYGLAHIHCRSVIHRDIKLDNILLDCEKGVKICDFGVSKIIKKGQVIQEQCGTPAYLAPEIIIDKGYEGFFVDIWSLGVLLFAMLCGTVPFKAQNLEDLHKLILKGEFTFPTELSPEAQAIVRGMIKLNPRERLTIPQILAHPWLKETNEDDSDEEDEESKTENGPGTQDGKSAVAGGQSQQKTSDIDLKSIQGNVNYVNVDNLFYDENYGTKLSYTDYCCITEDFSTENIDEEALKVCENFGFPRQFMIKCLNRGDLNHATACYYLLTNAG